MKTKLQYNERPEDYYSRVWNVSREEIEDLIQISTLFIKNLDTLGVRGKFQKIIKWLDLSYMHKLTYKQWRHFVKYLNNYEEKNGYWIKGHSVYPVDWTETLKRAIRERDRYTCQLCKEQKEKLIIHHINYIKSDCNPNNLITLCCGCHMRTNYDRDYWINYFRK